MKGSDSAPGSGKGSGGARAAFGAAAAGRIMARCLGWRRPGSDRAGGGGGSSTQRDPMEKRNWGKRCSPSQSNPNKHLIGNSFLGGLGASNPI